MKYIFKSKVELAMNQEKLSDTQKKRAWIQSKIQMLEIAATLEYLLIPKACNFSFNGILGEEVWEWERKPRTWVRWVALFRDLLISHTKGEIAQKNLPIQTSL